MDWEDKDQRKRFLQGLAGLCQLHNRKVTKQMAKMYFFALGHFDIEDVLRAMVAAVSMNKFFPKPSEIIEIMQGSPEDVAEVEASKVWKAITHVGGNQSVVFDNPVTSAVVEYGFGGWVKLCSEMRMDEEKWFRKGFVKTYTAFSRQNVQHFGELAGRAAISNAAHCKPHHESLALIGDADQAQAALAAGNQQQGCQITMLVQNTGKQLAVGH